MTEKKGSSRKTVRVEYHWDDSLERLRSKHARHLEPDAFMSALASLAASVLVHGDFRKSEANFKRWFRMAQKGLLDRELDEAIRNPIPPRDWFSPEAD